jgi:hypothetical protein
MRAYHPVLMTLYPAIRSVFVPARSSPRPFDPMASASFQPVAASAASAPPRPAPRHPFAAAAAARRSSLSLRPAAHHPVIPLRSSAVAANTLRATHRRAVSARWVLPTGLAPICWAHPSCWRARVAPLPPLTLVVVLRASQVEETRARARRGARVGCVDLGRR